MIGHLADAALYLAILASASGSITTASTASWAFETGAKLSASFPPIDGNGDLAGQCAQEVARQLEGRLQRAVGDRFQLKDQLVAHLADQSKLDKICSIFDVIAKELKSCDQFNEQRFPAAVILLHLVCNKYAGALERNAECLSDMEKNVHSNCVDACHVQAGASAPSNSSSSSSTSSDSTHDDESVCKIGACVVRCVESQIQECDETGSDLKGMYSKIAGAQMLYGMEAGQRESNAYDLLKAKKFPPKCEAIVKQAIEASGAMESQKIPLLPVDA